MQCCLTLILTQRRGESFRNQVEASPALKRNLWQQVVVAKIRNQAALLTKLGKDGDLLRPLWQNVKSGDSDNREGVASKIYWAEMFGRSFVRSREGTGLNPLLNYGYTILRAATSRALMGSGLLPAFGIFHRNRYNAFPLADDMMEPFRPYVDEIVYEMMEAGMVELNKEAKGKLIGLLFVDTYFPKVTRPLDIALTMATASLAKCVAGDCKKLKFPIMK